MRKKPRVGESGAPGFVPGLKAFWISSSFRGLKPPAPSVFEGVPQGLKPRIV